MVAMISKEFVIAIKLPILHMIWMISILNHIFCDVQLKSVM